MRISPIVALALWLSPPAHAEAPLSAIDWLSDSVALPPAEAPDDNQADIATNALPGDVTVAPLDAVLPDALGLVPGAETGLPADLWGRSSARTLARRIAEEPVDLLPALRGFLKTLLLAELDPPVGTSSDAVLFLARVDRLLELGALREAADLIALAGPSDAEVFRRWFDVALLLGTENAACNTMRTSPEISPTYPARIFCLARGGDWNAAALTLETAKALDILSPEEDALLVRFLDPEFAEGGPVLHPPARPTPLTFRLFEAIGEALPTGALPVAFAHADLRPTAGWKARVVAAERLAAKGAIDAERLFAIYTERAPAASGGVWDRAAAVQDLEHALSGGDPATIAAALAPAWAGMVTARLQIPFAERYGPTLAGLDLPEPAAALAFRIGLLSPAYEKIAGRRGAQGRDEAFLIALARGVPETAIAPGESALAVRAGFLSQGAPMPLAALLSDDRMGEALLRAIVLFAEGRAGDLDRVSDAIALFRSLGLEDVARRASLQLLLLERRG